MDDERIIELFFARDEGAVTAASEKYGAYCRAVALGMLGDERDAQRVNGDVPRDAAQEGPEAARLAQKGAHFGGYQHMKNDRLSRCLGDIDEKFIDEAADYKKKGRQTRRILPCRRACSLYFNRCRGAGTPVGCRRAEAGYRIPGARLHRRVA